MNGAAPIDIVLALLPDARRVGAAWVARCPCHQDDRPSLSVSAAGDGTVLLHCHAGCTTAAVVETLGLIMRDLFPRVDQRAGNQRRIAATYDYRDAAGELRFQVVRYEPKGFAARRPDGQGGWIWNLQGVERVLYRLPELLAADPGEPVVIVEGEKDADRLRALGFVATTNPGGAGKWRPVYGAPLRARRVFPLPDNDPPGRAHARDVQQQLRGVAAGAWIVELPGLPPKGDVSDWLDAGGTADELRRLLVVASQPAADAPAADPPVETADPDAGDGGDGRRSQSTKLVELARDIVCFHAPDGVPYARLEHEGHHEVWPLRSGAFRAWLAGAFYHAHRGAAGGGAIRDALEVLAARAMFDGAETAVCVRVAGEGEAIYLDLGDPQWRAVRITAAGWEIVRDPPVRFRRPKGLLALPAPVRGGSIEGLRPFVNVRDDDHDEQWHLFVGCLLAAFRPAGPYPILALNGEQGTAKSTAARVHRRLIDPNKSATRPTPRDERDLAIAASNGAVISLDNLSFVPDWLSDALCRVSTGTGFGTRTLYENDEETLFDACRPIVINGIGVLGTRSDLLDRTIELELPRIPDTHRRDEAAFWAAFEREQPAILGALLDAVAGALGRWDEVHLDRAPRMADFARWVVAAEPALGWPAGSFLRAYAGNRDAIHELALDASLIVEPLRVLLEAGDWQGTATNLLDRLGAIAGEAAAHRRGWPRNPTALSRELARLAPNLRAVGIEVDRARGTHGRRSIALRAVPETPSPASPVSPAERAGDAMPASSDAIALEDRPSVTPRPLPGDGGDAGDGLLQRVSTDPHLDDVGPSRPPFPPAPPADEQMRWTE